MEEETKPVEGLEGVKSELEAEETSQDEKPEEQGETETEELEQTAGDEGEPEKEETDYKVKFSESTRENQRIREENQALEDELEEARANSKRLEESLRSNLKELEETDPASAEVIKIKQKLAGLEKSNLLEKEARVISEFIERNPQAKDDREALKALMRANPRKSAEQLYERHLKPAYNRGVDAGANKLRKQKSAKPETGKGSKTGEPTGEFPDGFNSWSLDKRKAYFKRKGITGAGEF